MSVRVNVTIRRDNAGPALAALLALTAPESLGRKLADPLKVFWKRHLAKMPPNKRGWPRTRFWEHAANSIQADPTPDGVSLYAEKQGVRQRWLGGPIEPTAGKKALTIPISPVSYGKRASDFHGLFMIQTKKGAYLVQHGQEISTKTGRFVKRASGGGHMERRLKASLNFLFKLSPRVEQPPNAEVVPTDDDFVTAAARGLQRVMQEL
jgi:hypothetical protein